MKQMNVVDKSAARVYEAKLIDSNWQLAESKWTRSSWQHNSRPTQNRIMICSNSFNFE